MVTCPARTSPLKVSLEGLDGGSPRLSPGSWQNSMEELSKGLQRICHSPGRDKPCSPLSLTPPTPPALTSPLHNSHGSPSHVQRQSSTRDLGPPPNHLVEQKYSVIRVRHEESSAQLQRQLSRISGFNLEKGQDFQDDTLAKPVSPAEARRRVSNAGNRFRMQVALEEDVVKSLSQIVVQCDGDKLTVRQAQQKASTPPGSESDDSPLGECHTMAEADLASSIDVDRLNCSVEDRILHIREVPNKVQRINSRLSGSKIYLPVCVEEGHTWAIIYHVPEGFTSKNIGVKRVDNRLHITCRQAMSSSSSLNGPTSPGDASGCIKFNMDLPDNVISHSVQAALVGDTSQLLVYGRSTAASRARCQTL